MSIIDDVTVEDFHTQFPRFSPEYLPVWVEGTTYFLNDVVYYNSLFYTCIVENTTAEPTDSTAWQLTADSVLNYTQDIDIENAFLQADVNFPENLISDSEKRKMIFLYLAAHYLVTDMNISQGISGVMVTTSKSVGSVSESYTPLKAYTDSPLLSMFATTPYGLKYISMIKPYTIGNIILVKGRTTSA